MSRETFIQRRDNYFTLGFYLPRQLPPIDRLITYLQAMDTWRPGVSADYIANQMDTADEVRHDAREAKVKRQFGDIASTLYDDATKFWGTRSYPGATTTKEARAS